jgi:hypothetical protein
VNAEYQKLLRDVRWQKFKEKKLEAAGWHCERCGRAYGQDGLQVHHKFYEHGRLPWEYSLAETVCLCWGCHSAEHRRRRNPREYAGFEIDAAKTSLCEARASGDWNLVGQAVEQTISLLNRLKKLL